MSSYEINIDQAMNHLGQTFKGMRSSSLKPPIKQQINVPKEDTAEGKKVQRGRTAFQRHQAINAQLNHVAINVRAADQIMDTIGKFIAEMKAQLERIIKNYPPFPPGSEERAKILRSYNALRKEIEQITFPANPQERKKFSEVPRTVFNTSESLAQFVDQQVRRVKDLNLPELSDQSTDREMTDAILHLNQAEETLKENREMTAREAYGIFSRVEANRMGLKGDGEQVEFNLSEKDAESKSREFQRTMSEESIRSGMDSQSFIFGTIDESE